MQLAGGPDPCSLQCPHCKALIKTTVKSKATTRTYLFSLCLCLFFCWPCVCIPCCMDSCLNHNHYCPSCDAYLGTYET